MKDVVGCSGDNLYKYKGMYTKLRPLTREFLIRLGDSFELFVYTMGTWDYARNMGRLLDPEGVFFKSIVSKDDSTIRNRKNLDILAGPDEMNTIIIDDHEHVWEEHRNNVIRIDKYKYFTEQNGGHILKKNEEKGYGDEDESLKSIYKDLRRVHKTFFELFPVPQTDVELQEYIESADVRPILKACVKKKSGRKGEEWKEVPPDNSVEDLREEENRVRVIKSLRKNLNMKPMVRIRSLQMYPTIPSRIPTTSSQNMDKLLTEVRKLSVFSGIHA
ncbi:hypothetical protein MKX03_016605 [Papaver bracteatum]|nr:hypothetical protein MKX03_016605 [Papaver bracteatum]